MVFNYVLAVGEPPLCLSFCLVLAMHNALESARKDASNDEQWFDVRKLNLVIDLL